MPGRNQATDNGGPARGCGCLLFVVMLFVVMLYCGIRYCESLMAKPGAWEHLRTATAEFKEGALIKWRRFISSANGSLQEFSPPAILDPRPVAQVLQSGGLARMRCPHCQVAINVEFPKEKRGLSFSCRSCSKLLLLAEKDESGRFKELPKFLTGFRPDTQNGLSWERIWMNQLAGFRYNHEKSRSDDPIWQTPAHTWKTGTGVCRDSATLLTDWLRASGYDARVVLGVVTWGGYHAWVVLIDPKSGKQYLLESTSATQRFPLRTPPLTALKTEYTPTYQILPDAYLGRTTKTWTSEYLTGWYKTPCQRQH